MKDKRVARLTLLAFFIAIEVVISLVPLLGFIPLGFINATTLHIPVIMAAIMLGKKEGAIIGFVFGLLSMLKATFDPNLTSFVFSPFITVGEISGTFSSLLIAFIPRILIGLVTGSIFDYLRKRKAPELLSVAISAVLGSLTNTILVLSGIFIFFGQEYAQAVNVAYDALITFLATIIAINGITEAIVAAVISGVLTKASIKVIGRRI